MSDVDRCYRLTVIQAPEVIDTASFEASFFEQLATVVEITDMRIEFKIEKHLRKTPNQAEIKITNLAESSRESFVGPPVKVRLEAGYENKPSLMFVGDVRFASNEHTGVEWVTKLQVGDGARAFAHARVNRSYSKGTPVSSILSDIAKAFGTPLPADIAASPDLRAGVTAGEVVTGYASDELTRILLPFGYGWSFQGERLQILREDAVVPGVRHVISQDDGMIGSPTIDPPKIQAPKKRSKRGKGAAPRVPKMKVKHTLFPELNPGEVIEVRSRSLNGAFRIDALVHEGDNHGADWTTTIEGTAV